MLNDIEIVAGTSTNHHVMIPSNALKPPRLWEAFRTDAEPGIVAQETRGRRGSSFEAQNFWGRRKDGISTVSHRYP